MALKNRNKLSDTQVAGTLDEGTTRGALDTSQKPVKNSRTSPKSNIAKVKSKQTIAKKAGRSVTRSGQVLKALNRKNGASIEELMKLTGWQAHSVRGFLSGTVKKKQGLDVVRQTDASGNKRYQIASREE